MADQPSPSADENHPSGKSKVPSTCSSVDTPRASHGLTYDDHRCGTDGTVREILYPSELMDSSDPQSDDSAALEAHTKMSSAHAPSASSSTPGTGLDSTQASQANAQTHSEVVTTRPSTGGGG